MCSLEMEICDSPEWFQCNHEQGQGQLLPLQFEGAVLQEIPSKLWSAESACVLSCCVQTEGMAAFLLKAERLH